MDREFLKSVESQVGSDGKHGWPVAVRDRIAYYPDRCSVEGNVAVTFLWTMRDAVVPKFEKKNLAIATNFYTPAGLEGMIRNILGNPCIRYVIMLGEEYSSQSKADTISDKTSANAIRTFFERGLDSGGKLPGFETAVHIDRNIPLEMVNAIRESVQLIDLNRRMPHASLDEKIAEANRLMATLEKKQPLLDRPRTFGFESADETLPFEGGPIMVHESTIPRAWVEMIHNIYRYGRENLMNANTDRWVKETNNMTVVVHDPQNMELSFNPFLVPLTREKIEAYNKEILSSELPKGKAYTYGNKLRAYSFPSADEVKSLVGSREYKDFEFGRGPHLDANIKYTADESRLGSCEINQIADIIDVLKRDIYSKACVAITWHVQEELMRKHKSSPCLVFLQAVVQDEKLNLTVFFRSHDMVQGWPENAYGCAAIQKEIADAVGIGTGTLTIISGSGQIYRHYYQQVKEMLQKFRGCEEKFDDARGNFVIEVDAPLIIARLVHPQTGKELERFEGETAKEVYAKIAHSLGGLQTSHALYLGTELQKAELKIRGIIGAYQQDADINELYR